MRGHINEGQGSFPLPTFTQLSVRVGMSLMVRCMIPVQLLAMFLKPWTEIWITEEKIMGEVISRSLMITRSQMREIFAHFKIKTVGWKCLLSSQTAQVQNPELTWQKLEPIPASNTNVITQCSVFHTQLLYSELSKTHVAPPLHIAHACVHTYQINKCNF